MFLAALALGCSPLAQSPTPPPGGTTAIAVTLTPVAPTRDATLRWSPKAAKVDLQRNGEALVGTFPLGPAAAAPVAVRLERSAPGSRFDILSIDLDRDGAFAAAERLTTTPKEQRGKWWSSFEATAQVPFGPQDARAAALPYPLSLWFVEDPQEPNAPPALRWTRRGWHEGQATIDGKVVHVLLTEMALDGVFTTADAWALAHDRKQLLASSSRSLADHCWLGERAFRAVQIADDGRRLVFESFDPGTTQAEELARADIYKKDRDAKRAERPLAFGGDYASALAAAKKDRKRVFVDFATTWCGPCKMMDQWVYTAADVVGAATGVVCVKLDGDQERELVKKFGIAGYPTMLLLEADGTEVRRLVGYQSVDAIVKFLAK
jgi:thiol-disulfide isomerase/thioredoxin